MRNFRHYRGYGFGRGYGTGYGFNYGGMGMGCGCGGYGAYAYPGYNYGSAGCFGSNYSGRPAYANFFANSAPYYRPFSRPLAGRYGRSFWR